MYICRSTHVYTVEKSIYTDKKKDRKFPVPSRDVTTKLSLGGNNDVITELFLPSGSLVSDIPAGDGKLVNLFLRCIPYLANIKHRLSNKLRLCSTGFFLPWTYCLCISNSGRSLPRRKEKYFLLKRLMVISSAQTNLFSQPPTNLDSTRNNTYRRKSRVKNPNFSPRNNTYIEGNTEFKFPFITRKNTCRGKSRVPSPRCILA